MITALAAPSVSRIDMTASPHGGDSASDNAQCTAVVQLVEGSAKSSWVAQQQEMSKASWVF